VHGSSNGTIVGSERGSRGKKYEKPLKRYDFLLILEKKSFLKKYNLKASAYLAGHLTSN
jgi:hypothetical protein